MSILSVRVPVSITSPQTATDVGTIKVPLVSDSLLTGVSERSEPLSSSTLLVAKAQAYRYVIAAHSIGGSSGQAEIRGNDAIMALGLGFVDTDAGQPSEHVGSEGTNQEIAATYMHELGHLLNIQHGGPRYLLDDPDTILERTLQNCVPMQRSIMSYTGQLPAYLSGDWGLRFNEEGRANATQGPEVEITLNENTMVESVGITRTDGALIVYATPESTIQDYRNDRSADGFAIDWNGDSDTLDTSPHTDGPADTILNLAAFDVNNFGISGCEASPGEIHEIFNEPANFDFNFRDGPYGQFDGGEGQQISQTGVSDENVDTLGEKKLAGSVFDILPPIQVNGLENKKAGANIPIKIELFERGVTEADRGPEITEGTIRVDMVRDVEGSPVTSTIGFMEFEDSTGHWHFNWQTGQILPPITAGEVVGIQLNLEVEVSGDIVDFPLILSSTVNPIVLNVEGEGVTILVTFK